MDATVHATNPHFSLPTGLKLGQMFVVFMIACLACLFVAVTLYTLQQQQFALTAFLAFVAAWMFILLRYVGRQLHVTRHLAIILEPDHLNLALPCGRSLIHKLDSFVRRVPVCEIQQIETRLEAVKSLGMVNMQRWYALRLHNGDCIMLGEERALATPLATSFWGKCVAAIVETYDLAVQDLGMVPAQGGFLSVLGTRPPAQGAATLSAARQAVMWRRARYLGIWVSIAALAAIVVNLLI